MTGKDNQSTGDDKRRKHAERLAREKFSQSPENFESESPAEMRQTLHELLVHQIELEMQNEELRRAQLELDDARTRYFDLYDLAPVGYVTLSKKGQVLEANLTAATLLGVTRSAINRQLPITKYILSDDQDIHYFHRNQLFDTGVPQEYDLRMLKNDGTVFWVRFHTTVVEHTDNTPACRVIISDISERIRTEDALRQLEQKMQQTQKLESLGVMAGGIAHDFNNILFAILGNADLALMEMPPEAVGRGCIGMIQVAARRAAGLTDQMLAYSGKGALVIEQINLSVLVQEMAHLLEISHSKKAIVKYHFHENLFAIEGDASQLRQVVMNLITNASEAVGNEGGIITVETGLEAVTSESQANTYAHNDFPESRCVYLRVTDTGCGMEEATRIRVFEPFFTTKFAGRGLGMAAVLGIVRAHKGAIDIQSEVNHGTTITVLLPALNEPAKLSVEEAPQEENWTAHGTVLVVDDEPQVRHLLRIILERKGFTVITAADGRQATDVFRKYQDVIVCVLLDLTMPHMGGEEAFSLIHQIRAEVPVLLVSGYSEEEVKERFDDLGFAGFLKKPVGIKVLLNNIRAVLNL
ncbi:MAG: two-component system cell cycle sensor histidine kinase/response regulator CckA [Candidatus Krumholzibacteriia bacterium]|jgi:two-component system cell cycle sensor histidine kinase/response regulator CckA